MKSNKIIELIGVTILSGSLMAGCTLLPPVHEAVLGPDEKDSNESNAQINTTTNNIDIEESVETLIDTLPINSVNGVAYSTFSVVSIDYDGNGVLYEFDNPNIFYFCFDPILKDYDGYPFLL